MTIANLSPNLSNILISIFIFEMTIGTYLWWRISKAKAPQEPQTPVSPETEETQATSELSYLFAILALLFALIVAVTVGSIMAQMDRPFYAINGVGGSEWILTPAHYILFFTCYPVYLLSGALIYLLVQKNDPAALPKMKWYILAAALMPLMFIPAVNGDLLDNKVTFWETIYLGLYQAANIAWIVLGLVPVGLYAFRKILASLSENTA